MSKSIAFVYDANPLDRRGRQSQIEDQLTIAGVRDRWEVHATSSRNQLLVSLDADRSRRPARESTTLIDLRAETGDLDQKGFRICQTIVSEPHLNVITRPIIWTDTHTAANFQRSQEVGAIAVVDDGWVDQGRGGPLAEVLEWAVTQPASPSASVGAATHVFPQNSGSLEDERLRRNECFERWFDFSPTDLHFALLWGMADSVELEFLKTYLTRRKLARTKRSAKRELERIETAMSDRVQEMERPGPARAEIARRFLAEIVPPHPNPLDELGWPRLEHVRELMYDRQDIVRWAYLPPDGARLLQQFFARLEDSARGIAAREAVIDRACGDVAEALGSSVSATRALIRRFALAVDDAFADWLDYPEPVPLA